MISSDLGAGVRWISTAAIIGQGATLLAGVLVAKVTGPRDFGVYGFLQSTLTTWSSVASLSSGLLATRYLAAYSRSDPRRAGEVLGHCVVASAIGGLIAAIALALSRSLIIHGVDNVGSLQGGLIVVAIALPFSTFSLFQSGALIGLGRFRLQSILVIAQSTVFAVGPFLGALINGPEGAAIGLACAFVMRFATHGVALRRAATASGINAAYRGRLAVRGLFLRFALPASLTGLTASGSIWFASLLLVAQPRGSYHMGLFSAALNFRLVVLFLPVQISTIGVQLLTSHLADGEHSRFWAMLRTTTILTAVTAGGVALILALFARQLLNVFGPGFAAAQSLVHLMLIGAVVEAVAGALYQALPSRDQMWRSLLMVGVPRDAGLLFSALVLVPRFQSIGLGIALLISQCIGLIGVVAARTYRSSPLTIGTDVNRNLDPSSNDLPDSPRSGIE